MSVTGAETWLRSLPVASAWHTEDDGYIFEGWGECDCVGVQSSGLEVLVSVSEVTDSAPGCAGAGGAHRVYSRVSQSGCPSRVCP